VSVYIFIGEHSTIINLIAVCNAHTLTASLLPALCFIGVSFAGCDRTTAIILMSLGTMFMAAMYCGILANPIDLASNYSGTLLALTNTAATIPGFIVPVFVGALTHGNVS
jgi:ACS family sodium-dependent inorganic phosphate cotransporter